MKLVLVGGQSRNIGKTSVMAGLIQALPQYHWTAIKLTLFGHNICAQSGKACDCAIAEHPYLITPEQDSSTGTDTSRYLAAGAAQAFWARVHQQELVTALPALQAIIQEEAYVIIESNSLRQFITPDLYLQVIAPNVSDVKLSAQRLLDLADAYLVVTETGTPINSTLKLSAGRPRFYISPAQAFISPELIQFVKARLQL